MKENGKMKNKSNLALTKQRHLSAFEHLMEKCNALTYEPRTKSKEIM